MRHQFDPSIPKANAVASARRAMKARADRRKAVAMSGSLITQYVKQPVDGQELLHTLLPEEGLLMNLMTYLGMKGRNTEVDVILNCDDGSPVIRSHNVSLGRGRQWVNLLVPVNAGTRFWATLDIRHTEAGQQGVGELYFACLYAPKPSKNTVILVDITKENAIETLASLSTNGGSVENQ